MVDNKLDVEMIECALCNMENMERFIPMRLLVSPLWKITKCQLEVGLGHCTLEEAMQKFDDHLLELLTQRPEEPLP